MNKLLATLLVSAGLAAGAPLALAQSTAAPGADAPQARPGPRAEGMHRHHHAQRAQVNPSERVEARLAYVRTALKITDAQQPQWDAFADVLRKHARQMDGFRQARQAQGAQPAQAQAPTAIDRLERRQKRMTLASQRLNEVVAAAKPLYAALTPEQQKIADDMLARQGHHRGMHRGA